MNPVVLHATTDTSLSVGDGLFIGAFSTALVVYILYHNRDELVCHDCGHLFPGAADYCPDCGAELELDERPRNIERVAEWLPTIGQGPDQPNTGDE
jgi:DNA-directed RNA polymerase subunit RPC12/RpoP